MKINEINEILRKILALFDDPHLGISTWHTNVVKLQRELQDKIDEAFHQEVDPGTPEAAGRGVDI